MALLNQTKFIQPIRSNTLYDSSAAAMAAIDALLPELKDNAKADGVKFAAKYKLASGETYVETWLYGLYNASVNNFTFFDASVKNINAIKGDIIDLQDAIGDGSVAEQISDAIDALKGDLVDGDAETLKAINDELDGIDAAYKAADNALKTELLGEVANEDAKTIAALNDKIEEVEGAAKSYAIALVEGEELEGLGTNVREAYKLVDEDSVKVGEYIKIYKDSSLKSVALDGQILKFTYILADGSESTVDVDVSLFLAESEFGNGLQVADHIVSIKLAEGNESFLTVNESGVKLSGVQAAIDAEKTRAEGKEAELVQAIADEKTRAIAAEQANAEAIETLDGETVKNINVNGVSGNVANNTASLTIDGGNVKLSTNYVAVGYPTTTNVTFTPVASESTIDEAIKQVDSSVSQLVREVLENEATVAAALTKIKESAGFDENAELTYQDTNYLNSAADLKSADVALDAEIKKLNDAIGNGGSVSTQITTAISALDSTVTGGSAHVDVTVTQVDGVITAVAVAETDIASADALANEITNRENAIKALNAEVESTEGTYVKVKVTEAEGKITDVIVTEDFSNIDCGTF